MMEDGEYLAERFVITNRRTYRLRGEWRDGEDSSVLIDLSRIIAAFVGTSNGVLERLGALVERRHAFMTNSGDSFEGEDAAGIQALITDSGEDIFRRVLSFLASGIEVSD